MAKETIRDFNGRIIGTIETHANGDKTVRNFNNVILGYYKKDKNVTTDFNRRILAKGDCTGMLFR